MARARKTSTDVRRDQIAQAALGLVARSGLGELSVARLAEDVGLVPSALYRHYRGKDQIIDAMLDMIETRLLENVKSAGAAAESAIEQLRLILLRHLEMVEKNPGIPRIIFSEEACCGRSARRSRIRGIIEQYLRHIRGTIAQGQRSGTIRRELDADAAALMFLGLIQPAVFLWHMSEGKFDFRKHACRAWKIFEKVLVDERSPS